MRRGHVISLAVIALALGVLGAILVIGGGGGGGGGGEKAAPKLNRSQQRDLLLDFARANGEPDPRALQTVESDRTSALRMTSPGDRVIAPTEDVFVLTARGRFTGYLAHVPPGQPLPTGSALSLTVEARTGKVLDWSLTSTPPNLAPLGSPRPLAGPTPR